MGFKLTVAPLMACALMPPITARRGRERRFFKEADDKIAALTALRLASPRPLALRFLIAGRERGIHSFSVVNTPAIKAEGEREREGGKGTIRGNISKGRGFSIMGWFSI